MTSRAERIGVLLQGIGGLALLALVGVAFLPEYGGGPVTPAVAGSVGLVFCGFALGNLDEGRRRAGTGVAVLGSLGLFVAASYGYTADGDVASALAVGFAALAVLAVTAVALAHRDHFRRTNPRLLELGSIGLVIAPLLLVGMPPGEDKPFRALFFGLAIAMGAYGVVVLAVSTAIRGRGGEPSSQ